MKQIPLSDPNLDIEIVDYLKECVETGWISTGGRFITEFEQKLAQYAGVNEVVGVQSGTAALHLVYDYFNFTDCEVICPTVTFVATINPLVYLNSYPVFMDCDDTLNMDLDKLEEFCEYECEIVDNKLLNKKTKRHVKGLVVVHIFGNPINMERVMNISEKYHLIVVEDAAESLGSFYSEGKYAGKHTGTIAHAGIFSFNANKIITTGGGGAIVSNDQSLLDKVRFWSVQSKTDPLYFIHDELGYNYRLLNINAAIGKSQIERLEEFVKTKKENYDLYKENINKIAGLSLLPFKKGVRVNYWFYSLIIDKEKYGLNRDELLIKLNEQGINTRPLWGLMHQQKHLQKYENFKIEKAYFYVDNMLNLPCSSNLSEEDINIVIKKLLESKSKLEY